MTAAGVLLSWFVSTAPGLFTLAALAAAWVTGCAAIAYIKMGTPEKASRPASFPRSRAGEARAARRLLGPPGRRAPGAQPDEGDRTLWWLRAISGRHPSWVAFALKAKIAGLEVITRTGAQALRHELPVGDQLAMFRDEVAEWAELSLPAAVEALHLTETSEGPGAGPGGTPAPGAPGPDGETGDEDGYPPAGLDARAVPAAGPGALPLPAPPPHKGPWDGHPDLREGHPLERHHDAFKYPQRWHDPEPQPAPVPPLAIVAAAMQAVHALPSPEYLRHLEDVGYTSTRPFADWERDSVAMPALTPAVIRAIEAGDPR